MLLAAFPALAGNVAYTYDDLNRLTGAVDGEGTVIEYHYDAAGNRTSHIVQVAANLTLTLAKAGTGNGTVGGGGSYPAGATVTLTATADIGSSFTGWGPSPCAAIFTMPATDLTCTATFSLPTLKINDVRQAEGNSGTKAYTFTVTLSPASTGTVTVKYATANGTATAGSDYTAVPATLLTFSPGQTSQPVTVQVLGDTNREANETFFVNLTAPSGATLADGQGQGTLLNDDGPRLKINDVRKAEGNSGTGAFTFTVTLSPASTRTVTVKYATANGTARADSDYLAIPATLLTFSPGQTSKPVTVQVLGNTIREANETFVVKLSAADGATLFDGQGIGTIVNDDLGQVPNWDEGTVVGEAPDGADGSEVDEGPDLENDSDLADDSDLGPDAEQER